MSDAQVAVLDETNAAALRLANRLYDDPKTRERMQALIKEVAPQAHIPEYDARQAVQPDIAAVREELKAEREAREQERRERSWREQIDALKADPQIRLTDDEVPRLVELMKGELIGKPAVAARYMRNQAALANPTSIVIDPSMRMPGHKGAGGDEFKGLWDDRRGWARSRIGEIMTDFRNGRGSKWD